ncbi:ABC transporter ATP-binding protein [Salinibius halmophilus]|uniref:ABC transporter ATP-binding protein n=1 Tax=Salinibius halmophilus TaxID=1853216 RepID=UPI000E669A81|nr:ABC transporter ATP-binding protein [Salinibius halmophilus]
MNVLEVEQLRHYWDDGVEVLDIESLVLAQGEKLLLTGASGSGKSTLLNIIAGLLAPNSGKVFFQGELTSGLAPSKRDALRASQMGIIYQQLNLLPYLNALDNVRTTLAVSGRRESQTPETLLSNLGIDAALQRKPVTKLSLGQKQRVAIARALIAQPSLILADEPTASLDKHNRDNFMQLLMAQLADSDSALLMVSHDPAIAEMGFDRVVSLAEVNRVLA